MLDLENNLSLISLVILITYLLDNVRIICREKLRVNRKLKGSYAFTVNGTVIKVFSYTRNFHFVAKRKLMHNSFLALYIF